MCNSDLPCINIVSTTFGRMVLCWYVDFTCYSFRVIIIAHSPVNPPLTDTTALFMCQHFNSLKVTSHLVERFILSYEKAI